MSSVKKGEQEAFEILETVIGIPMNKEYHDDNSADKMPDFKTQTGVFVEITHTAHNHNRQNPNKFSIKSAEEKLKILTKANASLERIRNIDYERTADGELSPNAKNLYKEDVKTIKTTFGFDCSNAEYTEKHEWCDCPTAILSADNVLKVIEDKSKNYLEKFQNAPEKISLLVFATKEERDDVEDLYKQRNLNESSMVFFRQILSSVFKTVFICEYNPIAQTYNTTNPKIIVVNRISDVSLNFRIIN